MLPRKFTGGIGTRGLLSAFFLCGVLHAEITNGQEASSPFPSSHRPVEHGPFVPRLNAMAGRQIAEAQLLQRINSLKIAARTLSVSGLEREASDLTRKAASLEKELQQLQAPASGGDHSGLAIEIHQLRHSIDGLRQEISLLRHELKHLAAESSEPRERMERMEKTGRIRDISPERQEAAPTPRPNLDEMEAEPGPQTKMVLPGVRPSSPSKPRPPVEFELVPVPNHPEDEPVPTPNPALTPEQVTEETSKP